MKVWITKYALTKGIYELDGEQCFTVDSTGNMIDCGRGRYYHGKDKEWSDNLKAANIQADKMRQKKISSLKKQIERLEKLRFE